MSASSLTPRQTQVFAVIVESLRRRGIPPTFREIGNALGGINNHAVNDILKALIRKKYISKSEKKKSRNMLVLKHPTDIDTRFLVHGPSHWRPSLLSEAREPVFFSLWE